MRVYKIDQLLKSTSLVKKSNGALKDMRANVTVGAGEYCDEIIALRKQMRNADTDNKKKAAAQAIEKFCAEHIIDDFVTSDGQRLLFVDEATAV